jgi:hypothetical protein
VAFGSTGKEKSNRPRPRRAFDWKNKPTDLA